MEKKEPPIFKNDLSPKEQGVKDAEFEKEKARKDKLQKGLDIADGIATLLDILTDL